MGVATGCGFKEIYRFPHTTQGRIQGGAWGAVAPPLTLSVQILLCINHC